jgi:hypothetical protein
VNRLPVVRDGELMGIVARADVVRAFARPDAELEREAREELAYQTALGGNAGTVVVKVDDGGAVLTGVVGPKTRPSCSGPQSARSRA